MLASNTDKNPQTTARIAGFSFLCLIIIAIFGEFYLMSGIWDYDNFLNTVINIKQNLTNYKIASATELLAFVGVVILANALYIILKPVHQGLAQLALYLRITEAAIFAVILLNRFAIIILVSEADFLKSFNSDQIAGLVGLFTEIYDTGYSFGMIFFSLGSAIFSYLLFQTAYIPKALSLLGIFASVGVFIGVFLQFILPEGSMNILFAGLGIMLFEIVTGFWLLIKDVQFKINIEN